MAWERLGVTLAGLPELPWGGSGLRIYDHAEFLAGHHARIRDLGDALSKPLNGVVDLDWLVPGPVPAAAPLVLTHGDPGPGNFLDDGGRWDLRCLPSVPREARLGDREARAQEYETARVV
jgi:hypothetical protein